MQRLYFDIETTGPDTAKDRIIQLAIKLVDEQNNIIINKSKLYNPGIMISQTAIAVHGITQDKVKNCPFFKEDALKLKKVFEDKIIITYNGLIFDIPILMHEFERAGVEVELSGKFIDVYKIEQKINKRTLASVYKNYTGQTLDNAHNAYADINATQIVLDHQLERMLESQGDDYSMDKLYDDAFELSGSKDMVDLYGKFKRDSEGYLIFNFGKKCKGKRVLDEHSYADWMLKEAFPSQVKKLIILERQKQTKQQFSKTTKNLTTPTKTTSFMNQAPTKGWKPIYDDINKPADDELPF